ncbi:MAG: hypothetical protein ACRDAU_03960 [Clostridium sp.]
MINQVKGTFFQTFTITFIGILFLISLFSKYHVITIDYIWNLVGIGLIFGVVFGVIYPSLWSFSSIKAIYKICIASVINISGAVISVWLFSTRMFEIIEPWISIMLIITIIIHTIIFHFYSKYDNKKNSNELNELVKN